jgi:hypothetical protein
MCTERTQRCAQAVEADALNERDSAMASFGTTNGGAGMTREIKGLRL